MKMISFKLLLTFPAFFTLAVTSCSGHKSQSDNNNESSGYHSTEPAVPPDAEYPGSKLNDSIHKSDSAKHH